MAIDFYYHPASPPCRAVMMVAKELNVPLNMKFVDLLNGDQLLPEYLEKFPENLVPAIDDNGFLLWESQSILLYLVNKFAPGHALYPSDLKQRALVDRLLFFDNGSLFPALKTVLRPMIFEGGEKDPEKEKALKEKVALVEKYLEGKDDLVTDRHTVADLSIFATLTQLEAIDFDFTPYANVSKWMDRLKANLPYHEEVTGKPLKAFTEAFKAKLLEKKMAKV